MRFKISNQEIIGSDISAIWWRQKPFSLFYPDQPNRNEIQQFIGREWHHLLNGISAFFSGVRWVNDIQAQMRANAKPNQLVWAAKSGFRIPPTHFTNDAETVRWASTDDALAYKTLSGFVSMNAEAVMTTIISESQLDGAEDRIGIAPGIYQRYVPKLYELRIIFIGDRVLSVKIDSQSHKDTMIDWRADQEAAIYSYVETMPEWSDAVRSYARLSGLLYGAIDAIVTPEGDLVFLECNPAGQWLWLEMACGVPVVEAVSDILLKAPSVESF